jgi:hypothetical protein
VPAAMSDAENDPVLAWLLDEEQPAMRWLASRDLLEPRLSESSLRRLRAEVPERGWAKRILGLQKAKTYWHLKSNGYLPYYKASIWHLQVLGDLGMTRKDERIANAVEFFLDKHIAPDGGLSPRVGPRRGHHCTTGNMARTLIRFGYLRDERVRDALDWIVDHQLPDGGWHCFWEPRGTLDSWEGMSALAEVPVNRRTPAMRKVLRDGAEFFLSRRLLHEGKRYAPWYWLRYPWHFYYDVLVGLDFLTALGHGRDPRMKEALTHLRSRQTPGGRWPLSSSNWYLGKRPLERAGRTSKMVTFLARRVLNRVDETATRKR